MPGRWRRIAILKPSALGDVAHALPVLSALRMLAPDARISWVINRGYADLVRNHPDLDEVIPFERGAFKKAAWNAAAETVRFASFLRKKRFDLVIDLQGLLRTGLMAAATGAPVRLGFAAAREGSTAFYTHRVAVPDADRIHAVDRTFHILEPLGGAELPKRFAVPIQPEARAKSIAWLRDVPQPWIAIAPGARWLTKRWPVRHFAELARLALDRFGGTVILVGTPDDTPLSLELAEGLDGRCLDLAGKTTVGELVAVLDRCAAVISNDTGPLHVAAALGKPCLATYLCTRIDLHGPYPIHPHTAAVATTVPCAGSYLRSCPHGLRCLNDVSPGRLWPALAGMLDAWASQHAA